VIYFYYSKTQVSKIIGMCVLQ